MRALAFGMPSGKDDFQRWAEECFHEIERATNEDVEKQVMDFTPTGAYTALRTFDATAATLDDMRRIVATLIDDIKKGGQNRAYPT